MEKPDNNIAERLMYLINKLGMNKNSFSKKAGFKNNVTIGKICNKQTLPNYRSLKQICDNLPEINLNWLLCGHGEPFIKENGTTRVEEERATYNTKIGIEKKLLEKIENIEGILTDIRNNTSSKKQK